MHRSKIIIVSGFAIDLSRIKAIRINTNTKIGPTNLLTVDLNTVYTYLFNPNENKFKKQRIRNIAVIEYVDYNAANEAMEDLTSLWQEYVKD